MNNIRKDKGKGMSIIVTKTEMPKTCASCEAIDTNICSKWTYKDCGKKRANDCPIKSVEGLIKEIKNINLDETTNNFYGMQKKVIEVIKKYCEINS